MGSVDQTATQLTLQAECVMAPKLTRTGHRHLLAAQRQRIGPLRRHIVNARTYARYVTAARMFVWWCASLSLPLAMSMDQLDMQLCDHIEALWSEGEGRNAAGDAISALQHFLRKKRVFPAAWQLFSTWARLEMPERALPMPAQVLYDFAGLLLLKAIQGLP